MLPLDTVLTFFVTALMLALAPGPDIIFVLTQSALYGMRAGVATTLGLISGLCFHTTIVAVGVAGIFMTSPLAFTLLTVVGRPTCSTWPGSPSGPGPAWPICRKAGSWATGACTAAGSS